MTDTEAKTLTLERLVMTRCCRCGAQVKLPPFPIRPDASVACMSCWQEHFALTASEAAMFDQ